MEDASSFPSAYEALKRKETWAVMRDGHVSFPSAYEALKPDITIVEVGGTVSFPSAYEALKPDNPFKPQKNNIVVPVCLRGIETMAR